MEMKPFFIEDEFIPNLPSLFWYLDIDGPEELKDDWSLEVSEYVTGRDITITKQDLLEWNSN